MGKINLVEYSSLVLYIDCCPFFLWTIIWSWRSNLDMLSSSYAEVGFILLTIDRSICICRLLWEHVCVERILLLGLQLALQICDLTQCVSATFLCLDICIPLILLFWRDLSTTMTTMMRWWPLYDAGGLSRIFYSRPVCDTLILGDTVYIWKFFYHIYSSKSYAV